MRKCRFQVDIVTEWNLKLLYKKISDKVEIVDIVTEWNLKFFLN